MHLIDHKVLMCSSKPFHNNSAFYSVEVKLSNKKILAFPINVCIWMPPSEKSTNHISNIYCIIQVNLSLNTPLNI